MKRQLRKLRLVAKFIDLDNFYAINLNEDYIILQGQYNSSFVKSLSNIFEFAIDSDGYTTANRTGVKIVLS